MSSDAAPGGPDEQPGGQAELADRVSEAVLAVPGVHDLHAGVLGEAATLLPGRRVAGVRLTEPGAQLHLVLEMGTDVAATADLVRAAVRPLVGEGPVDVVVEDVVPAAGPTAGPAAGPDGG